MLLATGAVLIATTVSAFVYAKSESGSMDRLFNANVEALADTETGGYQFYYNTITYAPAHTVVYCGTCSSVLGKASLMSGTADIDEI